MPNYTKNYKLRQPLENENYNVEDQNGNMSIIDDNLKKVSDKVDNIKIADGTLNQKGVVKLNNATNSTSTTEASTPNAVKQAMDRANSAFQSASSGKKYIAGKVGNVTENNTFTQIGDRIQADKNSLSSNLKGKGVDANPNEPLAQLANKVNNITIGTLNGKQYAYGQTQVVNDRKMFSFMNGGGLTLYYVSIDIPFWADKVICNSRSTANGIDGVQFQNGYAFTIATIDNRNTISGRGAFLPMRSGNNIKLPIPDFIKANTTMYWTAYS